MIIVFVTTHEGTLFLCVEELIEKVKLSSSHASLSLSSYLCACMATSVMATTGSTYMVSCLQKRYVTVGLWFTFVCKPI